MKIYKNQTEQSATSLGYMVNYKFASDKNMSPNNIDVTPLRKDGVIIHYEVTQYDENSKTANIMLMNEKEYREFLKI